MRSISSKRVGSRCFKQLGEDDVAVITTLGPAEIFGEMALIDDCPRSASIRAVEDTRVLVVHPRGVSEPHRRHGPGDAQGDGEN